MTLRRTKTAKASSMETSQVNAGNFWDVGNYKPALKRISNVPKLCDEMVLMFHERAKVEKHYAKELHAFAEKWEEKIHSGKVPEFGTMMDGWLGVTAEARQLSALHMDRKEKVEDIMKERIETWKKQNCKKSIIHLKSYKRASSAFDKAQGPWNKRKGKIDKYRANILKQEKEIANLRQNTQDIPREKVEALIEKAKSERTKAEQKLRQRIDELFQYKEIYRKEMLLEFQRCQEEEKRRLEFFKETLKMFFKISSISEDIEAAHSVLNARIEKVNPDSDLIKFAHRFGAEMPMIIPDKNGVWYEEGNTPPCDGGQAYTPSVQRTASFSGPVSSTAVTVTSSSSTTSTPQGVTNVEMSSSKIPEASFLAPPDDQGSTWSMSSAESHDGAGFHVGDRVRAIYDYNGTQADELTFVVGDEIVVTEPADADGWLQGTHQTFSTTGKFPGNYVVGA